MEAFEELIATSKEQSLILKGKWTNNVHNHLGIHLSYSKENALGNNVENHKKDGLITSSSSSASWSANNKSQPNNIESRRRRGRSRHSQLFDPPFPRPLSSTAQDT
ncbi:unnamed protein product [Brassica rapa subsp. narinosa]